MVKGNSIMKKSIILLSVLSLVVAMAACDKLVEKELEQTDNTPAKEVVLVPMTFSASYSYDGVDDDESTKTILDGLAIKWKAGDKIAIFDDVDDSTPHMFEATSDGATTSFTGSVAGGATKFFAVYPYSAAIDCNSDDSGDYVGQMNVNIPSVQRPVAGSFDPDAAVLAAYTDAMTKTFHFKVPFALAKFTVDYDDVYSVSFSSSSKNMTGSLHVNLKANGSIGTADGTNGDKLKTLTIKNEDNSPLVRGETYYAVIRYRTDGNSYTDFTANVGNTDCGYATKTASAAVPMARATINNLGAFSGMTFTTNRYRGYQDGLDVTIAGNVYNKLVDGDAVELRPDQNISDSRITAKVHFLRSGESYTMSGLTITDNIVLATTDPLSRATVTPSSATKLQTGSLVLEGVAYQLSEYTGTNMFNNASTSSHFDRLAFSRCAIICNNAKTKYVYATYTNSNDSSQNRLDYAVHNLYFDNCLISTSGTMVAIVMPQSGHTCANEFESLVFTNNVFYSSSGSNVKAQIYAYSGSSPSSGYTTDVTINNNLFYNVAANAGLYKNRDMAKFAFNNNVMFAVDGSNPSGNAKVFNLGVSSSATYHANASSLNNYAFGTFVSEYDWRLADDKFIDGTSLVKKPTLCPDSPIDASTNTATGTFVLTGDYDEYGPQPMPLPM